MKREIFVYERARGVKAVSVIGRLVLVFLLFPTSIFAQNAALLQGTISDELGGKVSGAEVQLRSRFGSQFSTTSDQDGKFKFDNLQPGDYLIEAKASGFANLTSPEIRLERGKTGNVDLHLKVAAINESVVITATGIAQREDEVSKVVSIVDATQIESKHELNLPEALRGTAGVRVQQQGSPGSLTTIRLRGQRTFDTAILLDGLRVRDAADINGAAASLITDLAPVAMDRVEILRGAGSSLYGSSAIGGVVNLVPETPRAGFHFEFGAEAGGLATFRERVKVSAGGKRAGFSIGVSRLDVRQGVDGEDQYGNTVGGGRFQFNPTSSVTIAGNLYGTFSNARLNDSPFALPGAFVTGNAFQRAVAGVNFQPDFNNPDQGRRHRLLVGSVRLVQQLNQSFSYSVAYQRTASNRRNYNGRRTDPRFASFYPFGDFEFVSLSRGATDTLDARLNLRVGNSNLVTTGFEFEDESAVQEFNPAASGPSPTDKQLTFAVFGQDQLSFLDDRLQLSFGIRGQSFRLRAADRPGALAAINTKSAITGDGSIAYLFRSTNTKIRAHVGNGFRAPSLYERFGFGVFGRDIRRFGDPTLKAEQSISVDAGLDQRLARDRVRLNVTWFYTHLQRAIVYAPLQPDPLRLQRVAGYANQPGGFARGLETSFDASPAKATELRVSYTFTNSDRAGIFGGLLHEYVIPKHAFGFNLNQRYRSFAVNFDLNRTGSYIAPIFENDYPFRTAELTFAGYTKADLFGSYERRVGEGRTMVLFVGADNIFKQRYFENGFLAPGMVGRGGIRFKF
jgi:iron complex outermembrane receptor protein